MDCVNCLLHATSEPTSREPLLFILHPDIWTVLIVCCISWITTYTTRLACGLDSHLFHTPSWLLTRHILCLVSYFGFVLHFTCLHPTFNKYISIYFMYLPLIIHILSIFGFPLLSFLNYFILLFIYFIII